jgi:hypothetical protein
MRGRCPATHRLQVAGPAHCGGGTVWPLQSRVLACSSRACSDPPSQRQHCMSRGLDSSDRLHRTPEHVGQRVVTTRSHQQPPSRLYRCSRQPVQEPQLVPPHHRMLQPRARRGGGRRPLQALPAGHPPARSNSSPSTPSSCSNSPGFGSAGGRAPTMRLVRLAKLLLGWLPCVRGGTGAGS